MTESPQNRRRLFRFRLRTLLLLPLLFAAGWWWITWPERTAARFAERLKAGDIAAARAMCDKSPLTDQFWKLVPNVKVESVALSGPNWNERLRAVRQFRLRTSHGELLGFSATRGRVSLQQGSEAPLFQAYQLRRFPAEEVQNSLSDLFGSDSGYKFVADSERNRVVARAPTSVLSHARAWILVFEPRPEQNAASDKKK